jgi:hypothetical protein
MKNAILQICEKLRGYSNDRDYFEVIKANQNEDGDFVVVCRAVEAQAEPQGAKDESDK